jgi:glycosyltransferase involved in cell wall biosynthesis/LmbE family N-acetylglucosaminyl deacetylase
MKARRILVFAPHPGDEVIGCGGFLAQARSVGEKVRVIVVTDGEKEVVKGRHPQNRRGECISGLEILGVEDVVFWGHSDQTVPLSGSIIKNYRNVVSEFMPDFILLPSPSESHADHRRVTRGVIKALEGCWKGLLLFFETTQPLLINTVKDISSVIELKRLALLAHASQMKQYNYEDYCLSLARLHGVSIGKSFAEGFLSYNWDGSRQNFFEIRPLISVIVRADNLLFLRHALTSLVRQNYDQIEVILLWHGAEDIDMSRFDYLDLLIVRDFSGRGVNFNLGISHAKGEYIAFLDHNGLLSPNHMELLVSNLHGNNEYDIVYSGCRAVHCEIRGDNLINLSEEKVFNSQYLPGRLILGNYIPIHSLLFRNTVFRSHKFDETPSAYEDWEMLVRLEMSGYRFLHVDSVTCQFNLFDERDNKTFTQLQEKKGYTNHNKRVLTKILEKLSVHDIEQIQTLVNEYEKKINELEGHITGQKEHLEKYHQMFKEYESIEKLLSHGIEAANIDLKELGGIAAMISRILTGEALFSIILPVYNTPPEILEETLLSVKNQLYQDWELCLVDDASENANTLELLSSLQENDFFRGKLNYMQHEEQGGIVSALADAVSMAKLPYLVFLDHDDLLHKEALLRLAFALKTEKKYSLLYTDSRTIDLTGKPLHICHKPDWSPENLLHGNYINHLTVVSREAFDKAGGFRKGYEGAQDLDLLLRLSAILTAEDVRHIDESVYDWRATSESVAYSSSCKPYIIESARRAINDHLTSKKFQDISVELNTKGIGFCCHWQPAEKDIEIIIPSKDNVSGLKNCINGLFQATDYPRFSVIIVSNNSTSEEMLAYQDTLSKKERIRIIADDRPFNWSALNNRAVVESTAPFLLFLNDDIEVMDREWLMRMSKYLFIDRVGAVGATLFYPDGSLQHNGIQTDENFVAANITTWGKKGELTTTRNVSAVTGACLLLKRETLELAGGFNEDYPRSYNDVDLCLSIREKGLRMLQTADVQLVHHEAESCGFVESPEKKAEWENSSMLMRNKWGKKLKEKYMASYEIFTHFTKIMHVREQSE